MEIKQAYEQYFNMVFGYLTTLTGGNQSLAEELTQETFFRATKKVSEFRGDCKLSTWLCQIAKYVYYQSLDKQRCMTKATNTLFSLAPTVHPLYLSAGC